MTFERLQDGYRRVEWSGSAESSEVNIQPGSVGVLVLPDDFVGAQVTILVPGIVEDEGTLSESVTTVAQWVDLYEDGSQVVIPVVKNKANVMPVELFTANGMVKFKSDQSETCRGQYRPVN